MLFFFRLFAAIYSHFAAHFFLSNTTSFMSALNTFLFPLFFAQTHSHKILLNLYYMKMEKKITIVHHDIFFDFFFLYLFDVDVKKIFGVCEGKFIKYFCSIELFEHLQNSKFITKLLFFWFLHPQKHTTWCEIAFCSSYIISSWSEWEKCSK